MRCAAVCDGDGDDGLRVRCGESNAAMRRASMHAHSTKDFNFGFNKPQKFNRFSSEKSTPIIAFDGERARERQKQRRARERSERMVCVLIVCVCVCVCSMQNRLLFNFFIWHFSKKLCAMKKSNSRTSHVAGLLFLRKANKCDVTCFVHAPKALEFV